jgi:hypothetical protein
VDEILKAFVWCGLQGMSTVGVYTSDHNGQTYFFVKDGLLSGNGFPLSKKIGKVLSCDNG